jgi:hypothetical protein
MRYSGIETENGQKHNQLAFARWNKVLVENQTGLLRYLAKPCT